MVDRRENRCLGSCNGAAKLTEGEVRAIRKEYESTDVTQVSLSKKYKLSTAAICQIINRGTWKHVE